MDSLILARQDEMNISSQMIADTVVEESSSMDHLVNAVESSKTDEAKLNEILALLHRITGTLSSFEQSPLLAEELKKDVGKEVKRDIDNFLKSCNVSEETKDAPKIDEGNIIASKEEGKYPPHRFAKETTSLRAEIEDAIRRKNVLDERLSLLIAQREQRRLEEELIAEKGADKVDHLPAGEFPQIIITADDATEEGRGISMRWNENAENSLSYINEAVINELRNDENEIPGLAESGLSSEINSLSITINNILEENKQLHAICSDFTETGKKETKGAKPKKKKKSERKSSLRHLESSPFGEQNYEENYISNDTRPVGSTPPLPTPFMKYTFDRKIKELIKEQTDMIDQLQKEKKKFNEKNQGLEKVVAELIKINRENRMKHVEEFQAIDIENCRLEDDLLSLKRQNQKLSKDLLRLKSLHGLGGSGETDLHNTENDTRSCSCSNHNICLEYFRLLLRGKVGKDEIPKQYKNCCSQAEGMVSESYHHISVSESNLNNSETSSSDRPIKFSSLPVIITEDHEKRPYNKRFMGTTGESDCNNLSEMNVLKARIDCIEAYFNQQINVERCSKNSGAITFSNGEEMQLEGDSPNNLDTTSPDENAEGSQGNIASEKDIMKLKRRVSLLLTEKEEMSIRIEELMGMMRELSLLFRTTKEELIAAKRERNFLLENFKKRCEVEIDQTRFGGEASIKILDLNQRLQEKCTNLQLELEKAWNEASKNALERDKMVAEKDKTSQYLMTCLAEIEQENSRLKSSLSKMEENNLRNRTNRAVDEESQTDEELPAELMKKNVIPFNLSAMKNDEENLSLSAREESLNRKQEEINANWQQSLIWLQRCFVEEKLHSQLLEAAERENSARVAVLQQRVKERGEKYNELLVKYKKLHLMLLSRKAEKKANRKVMKEWSSKIEEYNSTTVAIEDNYKIMLSSLGNNIGIAVEILAAHLFLSPSHVHPSPELSADPAFWFAAQCSRLRWLQAQLRKLCLRSWKNNDDICSDSNIKRIREKLSVNDFLRGHSLDLDNRNVTSDDNTFRKSYSTPLSPSKTVENLDHPQSVSPEYLISPPSEISNILTSLNDAELNLTSHQVKLTQSRNSQFNNLVGILQQTSSVEINTSSISSSPTSDAVSLRKQDPNDSEGISLDNSIRENLDKYGNFKDM